MKIEVHGHRGDRGNFPENTIPAFLSAVGKGANAIEMDVVISKDKKVVVSHEPYMNSLFMLRPNGEEILMTEEKGFNLYQMNYGEIQQFDAGSKTNKKFLRQQKSKAHKPLLAEVIETVETFIEKENKKPITYTIEIKSEPEEYGVSQPAPSEFVNLVLQILQQQKIKDRFIIQSFDIQLLEEVYSKYPETTISYLVEAGDLETNLKKLSFLPNIYCPHYKMIADSAFVANVHSKHIRLNTWTVNQPKDLKKMIAFGVDGLITDYPERALRLIDL